MVVIGHDRIATKITGKGSSEFMQTVVDPLAAMFKYTRGVWDLGVNVRYLYFMARRNDK